MEKREVFVGFWSVQVAAPWQDQLLQMVEIETDWNTMGINGKKEVEIHICICLPKILTRGTEMEGATDGGGGACCCYLLKWQIFLFAHVLRKKKRKTRTCTKTEKRCTISAQTQGPDRNDISCIRTRTPMRRQSWWVGFCETLWLWRWGNLWQVLLG